jgi:uracil-DNA glycosylase family 4
VKFAQKHARCVGCVAEKWGQGFVPPEVGHDPVLVVIGQGPGEQEALHSRPFHDQAPSGSMLNQWLYTAGIPRSKCILMNAVWCWLPEKFQNGLPRGNRAPTKAEKKECFIRHIQPYIIKEKLDSPRKEWVTVGAAATQSVLGVEGSVEKLTGVTHRIEEWGNGNF